MAPYGVAPYRNAQASGTAVAALVLAILSWVATSCLTSIPGFLLARSELAAIERGQSSIAGRGLAQAAYWISLAHLVLMGVLVALIAFLFAVGAIH
jgi:hypothetical protein